VEQLLAYTIIGLTTGAIYAVAASGLVVTYTTSGIFNIAHGATGMLAAFAYWQLRFDWNWPTPLALVVVLLILCPLFGAFVEKFIMRGLQGTSEVVRLTVTVALMAAMIGVANWVWPPESRVRFRGFFDGSSVSLGAVNVSYHKLIAFGCAIGVAVLLRVVLFGTRLGVSMRAVVDDRNLAQLNGARPDRVAMSAWAGSASLAGLAGILLAAEVGLNVVPLTLLVINAYAAAIVGRLKSLPWTFAGALILGVGEAYMLWANGASWFPKSFFGFGTAGLRGAMPVILLFIVLLVLPQERLRAAAVRMRERSVTPSWGTSVLGVGILIGLTVAISGLLTRGNTLFLIDGFILAIAALSLVPLTGYAGQLSLAPLTFAGLGAVVFQALPGGGSVVSLVGAVVIVAGIGAVVALPALRLQGIYLALATGAFALMVTILVFNQPNVFKNGVVDVPPLDIPLFDLTQPRQKLIFLAIAFSIVALAVVGLRRSPLGRRMVAMKDSSLAGATMGMNLRNTKLIAFAISAGIAALAGALDAGKVTPDEYSFERSLSLVLLAVVGGLGSVSGALFGGMLLGGNAVLASAVPSMSNVAKVMPGIIGITLGRNPDGASLQVAETFRPVGRHRPSVVIGLVGAVGLWALTTTGAIGNWQFFVALVVWTLGIVPNLPGLIAGEASTRRRGMAGVWLAIGILVAAGVDWSTALPSTGSRLLAVMVLVAGFGVVSQRLLDPTPRVAKSSPDVVGLDREFTDIEIEQAERAVGAAL
jgi:branched-chain amino acid transport system permease protein